MQAHQKKTPDERRRSELAKIHMASEALGIKGDEYRAFLKRITGQESSAGLDTNQRGAVLDELRGLGFRSPRTIENEGRPGEPQERLAIAIWRELGDLGVLHDPSDTGLRKFAATLTGLDRMEWANARAMNKVIEALKAWKRRESRKRVDTGQ
jgi:phage gp16-like protein